MDGASTQTGVGVRLQLKVPTEEVIEHAIHLNFSASNNEAKYEAIIVGLDVAISVSLEKICIRSDSHLVVGQINGEYEARDQRMAKYVSLINLRLGSFSAWRLEHIPSSSNRKVKALATVAASLPIKEIMLLPIYCQLESLITTNQVNEVEEATSS